MKNFNELESGDIIGFLYPHGDKVFTDILKVDYKNIIGASMILYTNVIESEMTDIFVGWSDSFQLDAFECKTNITLTPTRILLIDPSEERLKGAKNHLYAINFKDRNKFLRKKYGWN
jgi:hypothetical protein